MQNKLKPCPFCGEKACIEVFNGHMNFPKFRVECSTCEVNLRLKQTRDEAIEAWNTRQPAFDWKPIEELTEDFLKETYLESVDAPACGEILFYSNRGHYLLLWIEYCVFNNKYYLVRVCENNSIEDIKTTCSHYALLTPPDKGVN